MNEGTYIPPNDTDSESRPDYYSRANAPNLMKRHRQDVEFHHPKHKNNTHNHTLDDNVDTTDVNDPKVLKKILQSLSEKKQKNPAPKKSSPANSKGKEKDEDHPNNHVHRNSTIAKGESGNVEIVKPNLNISSSEELMMDVLGKLNELGKTKGSDLLQKISNKFQSQSEVDIRNQIEHENNLVNVRGRHYEKPPVNYNDEIDRARRRKRELVFSTAGNGFLENDEENDAAMEEVCVDIYFM